MSDQQHPYVPVDWAAKARAADAEENTYEARKAWQQAAQCDPQDTEADFFLTVYDAFEAQNSELPEHCGEVAEKLGAAADALRDEQDAADRFAPMAKRAVDLASRCIRGANFVREHYISTNRQDLQMADRRRDGWCAAAIHLLLRAESCAAAIPGAENELLCVRREALEALTDHGAGFPEKERRTEIQRLSAAIRSSDPAVDVGASFVTRLAPLKLPAMIALFVLSLGVTAARVVLCGGLKINTPATVGNLAASLVLLGLFFWAVRARDKQTPGYSAKMCAGIFLGLQAALLLMAVMAGRMPSPLSRGLSMPVDTLIVGSILLFYAFRSPLQYNWGSAVMGILAVGFLVFGLVSMPGQDTFDSLHKEYELQGKVVGDVLLTPEQLAALTGKEDGSEEAQGLTQSQLLDMANSEKGANEALLLTADQLKGINQSFRDASAESPLSEDGKYSVLQILYAQKEVNSILGDWEAQTDLFGRNHLLSVICVFLSDLGCAIGFLNLEPKRRKKAAQ